MRQQQIRHALGAFGFGKRLFEKVAGLSITGQYSSVSDV